MLAVRTPGAPQTACESAACDSAFPLERQGRLLRSRSISGLYSRSLHSGLQPPCLRFATAVTGRHARLGSRLLARLCRGRHLRRQTSTRLQGATLPEPGMRLSAHPAFQCPPKPLHAVMDDSQDGFGVSHLGVPRRFRFRGHLRPFPMWTAFPSSEYYGGSVALRLAARRAIPYSRDAGRARARRRCLVRPLEWGYSPSPIAWKVRATTTLPPYRDGLDLRRCVEGCMLASLEAEVRAMRLSPYRAGLADHGRKRLRTMSASTACYCPLWLSPPGKPLAQGSFLPNPSFLRKGSSAR